MTEEIDNDLTVCYILLSTGSEIIAKVPVAYEENESKYLQIGDPVLITYNPMYGSSRDTGFQSPILLKPWNPWVKAEEDMISILVSAHQIVSISPVDTHMITFYEDTVRIFTEKRHKISDQLKKVDSLSENDDADLAETERQKIFDDMESDMNAESDLEDILEEFFKKDTDTIH